MHADFRHLKCQIFLSVDFNELKLINVNSGLLSGSRASGSICSQVVE